eukprot:70187-Alexandrium_andersonii.AAC.1
MRSTASVSTLGTSATAGTRGAPIHFGNFENGRFFQCFTLCRSEVRFFNLAFWSARCLDALFK